MGAKHVLKLSMVAVPYKEPVSHPYPNPKEPGLDRDYKKL